jgi:1,2-dihydroxy-3-keto-5-methylthiopentene dioxygenase
MKLKAWHMLDEDQIVSQFDRNYNGELDEKTVRNEMGVTYHHINVSNLNDDDQFNLLKKQMGITYQDDIIISPEKFPNYQDKLKIFFAEHLHADDEIRLILEGSGYFDIRDSNDKWARIFVEKGDLITLPAGAYHRFTTDDKVSFYNLMIMKLIRN